MGEHVQTMGRHWHATVVGSVLPIAYEVDMVNLKKRLGVDWQVPS